MSVAPRELTEGDRRLVALAREKAFILYEGRQVTHHSCGICLARTFNLPTAPYQALRRGGITGEGECGAIKAGELVLGEYFGDPHPTGAVTETLRAAMRFYQAEWKKRFDLGRSPTIICHSLTGQFGDFQSPERWSFCTQMAAQVAELTAETLLRFGASFDITPIEELAGPVTPPVASRPI